MLEKGSIKSMKLTVGDSQALRHKISKSASWNLETYVQKFFINQILKPKKAINLKEMTRLQANAHSLLKQQIKTNARRPYAC